MLVLNGLLHIAAIQLPPVYGGEAETALFEGITTIELSGYEGRTFWQLDRGVSYGVALMTIIAGLTYLLALRFMPDKGMKPLIYLSLVVLLLGLAAVFAGLATVSLPHAKA